MAKDQHTIWLVPGPVFGSRSREARGSCKCSRRRLHPDQNSSDEGQSAGYNASNSRLRLPQSDTPTEPEVCPSSEVRAGKTTPQDIWIGRGGRQEPHRLGIPPDPGIDSYGSGVDARPARCTELSRSDQGECGQSPHFGPGPTGQTGKAARGGHRPLGMEVLILLSGCHLGNLRRSQH